MAPRSAARAVRARYLFLDRWYISEAALLSRICALCNLCASGECFLSNFTTETQSTQRKSSPSSVYGSPFTVYDVFMNYRLLGNTGLKVSELCLGTMTFGENFFNIAVVDQTGANQMVARSLEIGH